MKRNVRIPRRMNALQLDVRGYPIPYVVLRDTDGCPHFALNNTLRQLRVLQEMRCSICGGKLDKVLWFVGGPQSAFHLYGAYGDPALHHECMTYALQMCPYLAMPNYIRSVNVGTIDPAKLPPEVKGFVDISLNPERPTLFVAVAAKGQSVRYHTRHRASIMPHRPYVNVEYWRHGIRITEDEAKPLVEESLRGAPPEQFT
jgi:hypothetical protein